MNYYSTYTEGEQTNYPYSETFYEASPLNRIIKQSAPGDVWAGDPQGNSDHTVKFDYSANAIGEVRLFKVVSSPLSGVYEPALTDEGDFDQGELYKTVTKDENWVPSSLHAHTSEEFKDKEGHVVLKRTYENEEPHDTYYVYDNYGNLSYVFPPLATDPLSQMEALCYQYKYDGRNRLVAKKLPGKQWEYIVYDKLDKVVMTGPVLNPFAETADPIGWLSTKYDPFGRVAYTAYYYGPETRSALQAIYDNEGDLFERAIDAVSIPNDIAMLPYTSNVFPNDLMRLLTVNLYDTYDALSVSDFNVQPAGQDVYYNNSTHKPKGLQTGSWVRVLDKSAAPNAETAYTLYDQKARPIRNYKQNHLGGHTTLDTQFDFTGRTDLTLNEHRRSMNDDIVTVTDSLRYTPQERLLSHVNVVNQNDPELLQYNVYNALGQLVNKNVGGEDTQGGNGYQQVDYTYNIRGWLKSINNVDDLSAGNGPEDLFAFRVNYDDPNQLLNGMDKLYNGNISETMWRTRSDQVKRAYGYRYDDLNRLTAAFYQKPDQTISVTHSYDESMAYDLNGNIRELYRKGEYDDQAAVLEIDKLRYNYTGNRLMSVVDLTANPKGFKDGINVGDDYNYDDWGNMTADQNKEIKDITYNHLNLPVEIRYSGDVIRYIYDANGVKVNKLVNQGQNYISTDYLDGFQYVQSKLLFFPHAEGYVNVLTKNDGTRHFNYVYNYLDHLGNIRLSYGYDPIDEELKILEENNYYPFGLKHANYNMTKMQYTKWLQSGSQKIVEADYLGYKYKYNGKEWQDELGLNTYDYGFRQYMPDIGRWGCMDGHSESYSQLSPYNYVMNNPVRMFDLLGLDPVYKDGKYYDNGKVVSWDYVLNWLQNNDGIAVSYTFESDKKGNSKLTNTSSKKTKDNSFMYNGNKYTANSYMTLMGRDDGNNNVGDFKDIQNLEMGYIYQILGQAAYVIFDLYNNSVEGAALNESGARGLLDYKNIMYDMFGFNRRSLIQINGIVYNPNEAGNFLWGMVLEYYGSVLSPNMGAEAKTRFGTNGFNGRPDERWEQKAITAGRKFGLQLYQNKTTKSEDLILVHRLSNRE